MDILGYAAAGVLVLCGLRLAWAARGEWIVSAWLVVVALVIALAAAKAGAGYVLLGWTPPATNTDGSVIEMQDRYLVRVEKRAWPNGAWTAATYTPWWVTNAIIVAPPGTTNEFSVRAVQRDGSFGPRSWSVTGVVRSVAFGGLAVEGSSP